MIVDAHVHIGESARLQIDVDGEQLVHLADEMGFDKICCMDLTYVPEYRLASAHLAIFGTSEALLVAHSRA